MRTLVCVCGGGWGGGPEPLPPGSAQAVGCALAFACGVYWSYSLVYSKLITKIETINKANPSTLAVLLTACFVDE